MRALAVLAMLACNGGDSDSDTAPDTDGGTTDSATDWTGSVEVASAVCTLQPENVLRFDCAVTTRGIGPVTVRVLDGGTEVATWQSTSTTNAHTVTLWGFRPEATYTFEAFADETPDTITTGDLATGVLPKIVDIDLAVTSSGAHTTENVVFNIGCGTPTEALVVASADGDVLWYQEASEAIGGGGFSVTPEGTLLVATKPAWVGEWDLAGNVLLDLSLADGELTNPVHHDIERRNGLSYVLNAKAVQGSDGQYYAVDGFDVIDDTGAVVATWSMEGLLDPVLSGATAATFWGGILGQPAIDWAHANAISLDADNNAIFSLRYLDTILKVVGDPADPEFGTVRWMLVGDDDHPYPSDLTRISTVGITPLDFEEQHHVAVDDAGDLTMWDNRTTADPIDTRALRIHIDEDAGTADLVESWDAHQWCPGQGSAFVLPGGNVLVDCMTADTFLELEAGTSTEVWRMTPTCRSGTSRFIYRAAPIDLHP